MRIAITGANGFVGSNLANHFHAQGHEVAAVVRPGADCSLLQSGIVINQVDYNSLSDLQAAFSSANLIIHNAGKTRTRSFEEMIIANVVTTRRIIQACNSTPACTHLIFISSLAAGKPSRDGTKVTEDSGSDPVDWYGRSKLLSERLIRDVCHKSWTVVRPSSIYGQGERDFLQIFKMVNAGISFHLGREDQLLSLIHIDELAEFIEFCAENANAKGQVFYASDGEVYTHTQFTGLAARILGVKTRELSIPIPLARIAFHLGDVFEGITRKTTLVNTQKMRELININWICSIDKARKMIGWEPKPDLEANLRSTLDWYKQQGWL